MSDSPLKRLLKLQEADMRQRDMETRLENLPKEMQRLLARRDEVMASTAAAAARFRAVKQKIQKDEALIAELNAASDKLRQQTTMVKKNNEYQAMLASIELNKKKVSEAEDRILLAADELEAAGKAGARIKFANDAELKNLKAEFDELFAFSKTLKEEIARLREGRPALLENIPPALLSAYEALLRNQKGGPPLVPAVDENCGHCQLKITAQTAVALKRGEVVFCGNCQYMLYDPQVLEG
ncbi:MAG: hypothetical protein IJT50_05250 [Lentisphaeria bacterium]|nr:hypothetical protein [Lentisphaeria bacterium]